MNKYINICQDFDDEQYREFLRVIASLSDAFTLVIGSKYNGKDAEMEPFKHDMEPYCTNIEFEKTSWPGMGYGSPSNIYHYKVSTDSIQVLLAYTNSLFSSYNGSTVPEDLSFTKEGQPIMITTSHEVCATVYPQSEEDLHSIRSIRYMSPYAIVCERSFNQEDL